MQKFPPQAEQVASRVEPFVAGLLAALFRGFGHAASMAEQSSGTPAMRHYLHVPPANQEKFARAWQSIQESEEFLRTNYEATKGHVFQFLAPFQKAGAGNAIGPLTEAAAQEWNCRGLAVQRSRLRICVARLHHQANTYAVAVEDALSCIAIATECEVEDAFCDEEEWPAQTPFSYQRPVVTGNAVLWTPSATEKGRAREAMAEACAQLAPRLRKPVAGRVERAAREAVTERGETLWLAYQAGASASKARQADKAAPAADRSTIAAVTDTFAAHLGHRMGGLAGEAVDRTYGAAAACQRLLQEALQASAARGAARGAVARSLEAFVVHAAMPMAEEIAEAAADAVATLPQGVGPGAAGNLGPETIGQVFQGAAAEELARSLRTTLHAAAIIAVAEEAPELCAGLAAQVAAALGAEAGGATGER